MVAIAPSHPFRLVIDNDEREKILRLHERARERPLGDGEEFIRSCRLDAHQFPRRVRGAVDGFRGAGNREGALVLENLPVEREVGPTPTDPETPATWRPTDVSAWLLTCVGTMLGEPVGYAQEQAGTLIGDIFPTEKNAERLSSQSSVKGLEDHTEQAFNAFRPDFLLLYGVRPDHQRVAETFTSSIRSIFPRLTDGMREVLFRQNFKTDIDYSFGNLAERRRGGPRVRVLEGHTQPRFRLDLDLMWGVDADARGVLRRLETEVRRARVGFRLLEGTLAILDNHTCTHGRSKFHPRFDGTDRWVRRMSVLHTLARNPDLRPGTRILDSDFYRFLEDPNVNE